tara:strand:+ start:477 stop:1190 length:714 start_codon:yes stop_codon:yes gene_type:complete
MQTSDQTNELMEALSKAQGAFSNIKATRVNPFHKSKYAPLDEVIKMYRPILAKNDLAITHGTYHMNFEDGAKAFLKTRLSHKSGQWIEDDGAPLLVRSTDKNGNPVEATMQGFMAAVTYAKRLGSMAILDLAATEEDDDGESAQGKWAGPLKKTKLSEEARALSHAIREAKSQKELVEVQVKYMTVIDQLRHDLPVWYEGNEDSEGLKKLIARRNEELEPVDEPSGEPVDEPIVGDA